jgi:hypothetical protein
MRKDANRKTSAQWPLIGLAALLIIGCPTEAKDAAPKGADPVRAGEPGKPVIAGYERGYEVVHIPSWLAGDQSDANKSGVIHFWWNPVDGAAEYEVYAAEAAGGAVPNVPAVPIAVVTGHFYFKRGVMPDAKWYFWLKAKNGAGAGALSDPAAVIMPNQLTVQSGSNTTNLIERADYPKNLTAIPGDGAIALSWDKSDRAAWYEVYYSATDIQFTGLTGAPLGTMYLIGDHTSENTRRLVPYQQIDEISGPNGATPWTGTAAGTKGTPAKLYCLATTLTGLTNGQAYYIWVRSLNMSGERGMAKAGPIIPGQPMAAPARVTATPDVSKITVAWDKVTDATGYRVYWSKYHIQPPLSSSAYKAVTANLLQTDIGPLDSNTEYFIWVVAYKQNTPGAFSVPARAVTKAASGGGAGTYKIDKVDKRGNLVRNHAYIEVNDNDPRIAMGYVLEGSGIQFFDHVVLFAANLRNNDCKAEYDKGGANHDCQKTGVHLHYNGNVSHILNNRDKYIQPLQDRKIKVLLGLLNDWGGIGIGSFVNWPMEDGWPWADAANTAGKAKAGALQLSDGSYPYTAAVRDTFIKEVANEVTRLGLDGVDLDDEWGSGGSWPPNQPYLCVYPDQAGYGGTYGAGFDEVKRWDITGKNLANFIVSLRSALGKDRIISVYEWHAGRFMVNGRTKGEKLENGDVIDNIHRYFDYATEASYGSYVRDGYNNFPHAQYAPLGIDICGGDNPGAPRPAINSVATYYSTAPNRFMGDPSPFGYNIFYGLVSMDAAGKPYPGQTNPKLWDSTQNRTITQAEYLSRISNSVYGENVIYIGADYKRDWTRR